MEVIRGKHRISHTCQYVAIQQYVASHIHTKHPGLSWGSSQAETARLQRQYVGNPMYSQIRNIVGISGIVAISLKYIFG